MYNEKYTEYDKYVYENEIKDFVPDEFIDFHTHISKKGLEPYGSHNGGSSWTDNIARGGSEVEKLLSCYKEMFPQKKVTPLIFGGCLCDIGGVNDYVYEKGIEYNLPTLYRTDYAMDPDKLEEDILKRGFLGIKPYLSNCPSYIPPAETRIFDFVPHEHLKVCDKHGLIVMLHIPRDGRFKDPVNLYQLREIEEKYPNLKLIIAHIGRAYAREDIGNGFDIVGKGANTYFDFTANVCDDAIKACIEAVGPKKLIFGSDLPIAIMRMYRIVENGVYYNIVPRGHYGDVNGQPHMRQTDGENITVMMYEQIRALKRVAVDLKLSDSDIEAIMNSNAKKLIQEVQGK